MIHRSGRLTGVAQTYLQNFFWSALVMHNFQDYLEGGAYSTRPTSSGGPYMQLSPQRAIVINSRSGGTQAYS